MILINALTRLKYLSNTIILMYTLHYFLMSEGLMHVFIFTIMVRISEVLKYGRFTDLILRWYKTHFINYEVELQNVV